MKKLRIIKMINGEEIKGLENEFSINVGIFMHQIIHRQNGIERFINPKYISTDSYFHPAKKSKRTSKTT